MSRPRVLLVSHEASRTGAPRVALALLRAFDASGWEATIWHRWGGPLEAEMDAAAVSSVRQPMNRARIALRRFSLTKGLARSLDRWAIDRVLRRQRPDVVWCNSVVTGSVASRAVAAGVPTVWYAHEHEPWAKAVVDSVPTADLHAMVRVGCSATAASVLERRETGTVRPLVLRPAVDVAALISEVAGRSPSGGTPVVMGCGTADQRKGFDVFVSAARLAAAAGVEARWRWVGRADADVDAEGVEMAGEVAHPAAEMVTADVFVLSSRSEAFPLVVMEAMALGLPVVASDLPGTVEQLGEAGLLVEPGEPQDLLDAVTLLLADPVGAAELGRRGAERCVEHWDTAPFAEEVRAILEEAAPDVHAAQPMSPVEATDRGVTEASIHPHTAPGDGHGSPAERIDAATSDPDRSSEASESVRLDLTAPGRRDRPADSDEPMERVRPRTGRDHGR